VDILFILIPLSVVLALAIGVCIWYAVGSGQFEDLDKPAVDIIADDDTPTGV
jgi:cbb3-type cytochrome oxidase maturation protein